MTNNLEHGLASMIRTLAGATMQASREERARTVSNEVYSQIWFARQ